MANKFAIFVLFAVSVWSSLGENEAAIVDDLTTIHSAAQGASTQYKTIVKGFVDIVKLLVEDTSESGDAAIVAEIESIKQTQIAALLTIYENTITALEPITNNAAALTENEAEVQTGIEGLFELIHTVYDQFPSSDYATSLAAIESIETDAVAGVQEIWFGVFDIILNAVATEDQRVINLVELIRRTVTFGAQRAFTVAFNNIKSLLYYLNDAEITETKKIIFLATTDAQEATALSEFRAGVDAFSIFRYIAVADFLNDYQLTADFNALEYSRLTGSIDFKSVTESIRAAILQIKKNENVVSALSFIKNKLQSGFDDALANAVVAISYVRSDECPAVVIDQATGLEKIDVVVENIVSAMKLIQNTDATVALAEIDALKETAVTTVLTIFEAIYTGMQDIGGCFDADIVPVIETAWATTSVSVESAFENIFNEIKLAASMDTSEVEAGYGSGISGIQIVHDTLSSELQNEMSLKLTLIRALRISIALADCGINVPFTSLLES